MISKRRRDSLGGGDSTIHFSLMGPFYIFKRGAPFGIFFIFDRGDPLFHFGDFQKGGARAPPLNRPLQCNWGVSLHSALIFALTLCLPKPGILLPPE